MRFDALHLVVSANTVVQQCGADPGDPLNSMGKAGHSSHTHMHRYVHSGLGLAGCQGVG